MSSPALPPVAAPGQPVDPDRGDPARRAARQGLAAAIAGDPQLQGRLVLGAILRARPDRSVARGRLDGADVIVKHYPGPNAARIVEALATELALLAPRLSTGRLQVNRCLHAAPAAGIAILSRVPGEKLSRLLPVATPQERRRMLQEAGALILAYSEGRRAPGRMGPAFWLKKLDTLRPRPAASGDRALIAGLAADLARRSGTLRGATLCKAAVHGDFVPPNLHADEQGLYAFDIQGEARMPLSFDLARFLGWLAVDPDRPAGPDWLGVACCDHDAILAPGLPAADEDAGVLPFLLGLQIAQRLIERAPDPDLAPPARRAAARFLHSPA